MTVDPAMVRPFVHLMTMSHLMPLAFHTTEFDDARVRIQDEETESAPSERKDEGKCCE